MAQQTAISTFIKELMAFDNSNNDDKNYYEFKIPVVAFMTLITSTMKLNKEQIINAAADHCYPTCESARTHAEEYYNEIYNQNKLK